MGRLRTVVWVAAWLAALALVAVVVVAVDSLLVDGSGVEDAVTSVLGWIAVALVVLGTGAGALLLSRRLVPRA